MLEATDDFTLDSVSASSIQMQLDELSPPVVVSARRLPIQTDPPIDREQAGSAAEDGSGD